MFDAENSSIVDRGRETPIHPCLTSLRVTIPDGWAAFSPPQGLDVSLWLGCEEVEESEFLTNLLVQSVPLVNADAGVLAADLFEQAILSKEQFRSREPRRVVLESDVVEIEYFAATIGDEVSVTQNYFLVTVRDDLPTLIILTASAETGEEGAGPTTLKTLCESVVNDIVRQLSPELVT